MNEYLGKEFYAIPTNRIAKVVVISYTGGEVTIGIKWTDELTAKMKYGYAEITNYPVDDFTRFFKEKK